MKSKFTVLLMILAGCVAWAADQATAGSPAPRVVQIHAGVDNAMKFDVVKITAAPGESLKVVLTNSGTLPKNVMGHNWILLAAGTDPVAFAAGAAQDVETGYIPVKAKDKILAFVSLVGPKESGEVTFTAPTETGDYPFLCSFPAHCFVGMKGVLIVKK